MSEWKGRTALITGASYGIGEAFSHRLAADGANLVLTARSINRLESLANSLRLRYQTEIFTIPADLSAGGAQGIFAATESKGLSVELLVNNAGFGALGEFAALSLERQLEMIEVNIKSLVALTHLYLPTMLERRRGAVLNVASTASFQAVPYFAVYAATKAFVLSFSEALWAECAERGVRVTALCPGSTATHFQEVAGSGSRRGPKVVQTAEEVVDVGLRALARGRSHVVSGRMNALQTQLERFVPRDVVTRLAGRIFRPEHLR